MDIALDEVIHFDAVTHHPSTGAVTDADSTPTWEIFEEDTDTAIRSGNFTKRTSKTGNYRGTDTLSTANGYEVGKWYSVIGSATVNSIAGKAKVDRFRVVAAEAVAGYPKVDQQYWKGAAPADLTDTNKVQASVQHKSSSVGLSTQEKTDVKTEADTAATDYGALKPTTLGRTLAVDTNNKAPATLAHSDVTGNLPSNLVQILATTITETTGGWLAAGFKKLLDVASPVFTLASVNQTGDNYARLGAPAGVSIAADIASNKTDLTTLLSRLSSARAGYLDNLNVGGAVASQADVNALNQSASRRVILTSVEQYERPESGSTTYQIEARTYDGDGAAVNADSTPTLTATGLVSGSLAGNLSSATNPETGLYRWTYTVLAAATLEQIRFDISATISASAFPLSLHSQVVDTVAATFTTADRQLLEDIKERTDNLPDDPADDSDLDSAIGGLASTLATIAGYLDTEVAAIKLKTDNLPSDPADQSQVETAITNLQSAITSAISALNNLSSQQVRDAMKLAPTAGSPSAGSVDKHLDDIETDTNRVDALIENSSGDRFTQKALEQAPSGSGGDATLAKQEEILDAIADLSVGSGAGAFEVELTIKLSSSAVVPECDVIITSTNTAPNVNVTASGRTDEDGDVTFMLDAGTYFIWRQKSGINFSPNPASLLVNNDGTYSVS